MRALRAIPLLLLLGPAATLAQQGDRAPARSRDLSALDGEEIARALTACAREATGSIGVQLSSTATRSSSSGADGRCVAGVVRTLPLPPDGAEVRLHFTIVDRAVRFDGMRATNQPPPPPRRPPAAPNGPRRTPAENDALDAQVLACWSRRDPPCVRRLLESAGAETDRQFWWLESSLILARDHAAFCRVFAEHRDRHPDSEFVPGRESEAAIWCDGALQPR